MYPIQAQLQAEAPWDRAPWENESVLSFARLWRVIQRRRRPHSPDQPHRNERPAAVLGQVVGILAGIALFVFATVYFFARVTPIQQVRPPEAPEMHAEDGGATNGTSARTR